MPVKKIDTGIFTATEITGWGRSELTAALKAWHRGSLQSKLAGYERAAQDILRNQPSQDDPAAKDADLVLAYIAFLRHYLAAGNATACAAYALLLGEVGQRMRVRRFEKPALTGRKAFANLRKGRIHGQDRYAEARERHREWAGLAAGLRRSQPAMSQRAIARWIADNWIDDETRKTTKPSTVRWALRKKERPPNK